MGKGPWKQKVTQLVSDLIMTSVYEDRTQVHDVCSTSGCSHHRMVEGREDPLHATEVEHHGTLEQKVPYRSLPMGAPPVTGQSLDLEGWSYDQRP
jgi:hypothetical protein